MERERRWVHLLDVPVEPLLSAHLWLLGVNKEMHGIQGALGQGTPVSPRLLELAAMLEQDVDRPRNFLVEQLEAAQERGQVLAELWLDLNADAVGSLTRLIVTCDEIQECCNQGLLETPAPQPVAMWAMRWMVRELMAQLELGRPPRPCVLPSEFAFDAGAPPAGPVS